MINAREKKKANKKTMLSLLFSEQCISLYIQVKVMTYFSKHSSGRKYVSDNLFSS